MAAASQAVIDQFYEGMSSDVYQDQDLPNLNPSIDHSDYYQSSDPNAQEHFNSPNTDQSEPSISNSADSFPNDFDTSVALQNFCDNLMGQVMEIVVADLEEAQFGTANSSEAGEDYESGAGVPIQSFSEDSYLYGSSEVEWALEGKDSNRGVSANVLTYCQDQSELAISEALQNCSISTSRHSFVSQTDSEYYHYEGSESVMTYQEFPTQNKSQNHDSGSHFNSDSPAESVSIPQSPPEMVRSALDIGPLNDAPAFVVTGVESNWDRELYCEKTGCVPSAILDVTPEGDNKTDSDKLSQFDRHSDLNHVELYYAIRDGQRGNVYISELNCSCLTKYYEIDV